MPMRRKIFQLVGESNYQAALARAQPGEALTLVPEPTNRFDAGAIYLTTAAGEKLGYLSRDDAAAFAAVLYRARAVKLHRLTGGLPDYPSIGCEISVAWDQRAEHPHRELEADQRSFIGRKGFGTRQPSLMRSFLKGLLGR